MYVPLKKALVRLENVIGFTRSINIRYGIDPVLRGRAAQADVGGYAVPAQATLLSPIE